MTQLFLLSTSEQKTEDPDIRKHIRIHKASNMCVFLRIDCFPGSGNVSELINETMNVRTTVIHKNTVRRNWLARSKPYSQTIL